MKTMSTSELTTRINRFLDRKLPSAADLHELSGIREKRSQRRRIEVSTAPYISLAVK